MKIKKYLHQVLSQKEIIDLLPDKKVYFLHADKPKPPYIEYEIYNAQGAEYAENEETATEYFIQVDIFSLGNYSEIEDMVYKTMIKAGFYRYDENDMYEKDTHLYHKGFRFRISLERNDD